MRTIIILLLCSSITYAYCMENLVSSINNFRMDAPQNEIHQDPLASAIEQENLPVLHGIIKSGKNLNYTYLLDGCEWSPLGRAVARGSFQITQLLLASGANANYPFYTTPLIQAARDGNPEITAILLEYNAVVDKKYDYNTTTPLLAALHFGALAGKDKAQAYTQTIKILLQAGANLEENLHFAINKNEPALCRELLALGANPCRSRRNGSDAFSSLKKTNHQNPKIRQILFDENLYQ